MSQPDAAVRLERPQYLVRSADGKRLGAMADPRHMAELADRRQRFERPGAAAAGLRVAVGAVEMQHLVQPGLDIVPGLVMALGDMNAQRHRGDVARPRVVAILAQ